MKAPCPILGSGDGFRCLLSMKRARNPCFSLVTTSEKLSRIVLSGSVQSQCETWTKSWTKSSAGWCRDGKEREGEQASGKLTAMFVARTGEGGGNERNVGLGSFPALTLEGARQKAAELKRQVVAGIDPIEAKEAEMQEARAAAQAQARAEAAEATTFEMVGREYFEAHSAKWSNEQHRKDWVQSLRDHCGPSNDIPITPEVVRS